MPAAKDLKTLIVDDQRSVRAMIRSCLQGIGITQVIEAEDGVQALDLLSTSPRHLIISDLNMPHLDGLGLLRAVRQNPETAKTAFIMLSGHADTELVRKAVELGVNNYIVKPFTVESLHRKITAVFGQLT
ncbi:response regulator [uncultured Brevundimonas sp.]|uniref:response regulator n=1 Tax=uncultured Brevundimonas sp. TaxID=213418 RepID=UPI0030ECF118|tara:strand:- start:4835 stop:5224 length:390 start_codon:yes stop_codon:yes gene_type:complete